MIVRCPICRGIQVGRVGSEQYYCWNCYMEFNYSRGQVNLFEVAEDGTLMAIEKSSQLL